MDRNMPNTFKIDFKHYSIFNFINSFKTRQNINKEKWSILIDMFVS